MIRHHQGFGGGCRPGPYEPTYIDGWICNFFPYDKYGDKLNGKFEDEYELPSEILQAPFILHFLGKQYNCYMDAGFMGVKETKLAPGVYNVKPIIG